MLLPEYTDADAAYSLNRAHSPKQNIWMNAPQHPPVPPRPILSNPPDTALTMASLRHGRHDSRSYPPSRVSCACGFLPPQIGIWALDGIRYDVSCVLMSLGGVDVVGLLGMGLVCEVRWADVVISFSRDAYNDQNYRGLEVLSSAQQKLDDTCSTHT